MNEFLVDLVADNNQDVIIAPDGTSRMPRIFSLYAAVRCIPSRVEAPTDRKLQHVPSAKVS